VWLGEPGAEDRAEDFIRDFFLDCLRRFKLLTFCYFNLKATAFFPDGKEEVFINTRVSFPRQYEDTAFFHGEVATAMAYLISLLDEQAHSGEMEGAAAKVHLHKISLHSREDKSFKIVPKEKI
jgi:hypothetical protein